MTLVEFYRTASPRATRYFIFIVCICLFLFAFLMVRLTVGLSPEIYYEAPTRTVYRADASVPASSPAPASTEATAQGSL